MHDGEEPTTANELVGIQEKVVSKDRPRASALTGNNQPVSKARPDDSGAWMMDEDGPDADRVVLVMNPRSDLRADLEHPPRAAKITTVTDLLSSSPVGCDRAGDGAEDGAHNFEGLLLFLSALDLIRYYRSANSNRLFRRTQRPQLPKSSDPPASF
jgi:hypothetical protein